MNPSQPNSRERLQQLEAIDAEIKLLEDSLRALKYRRNALTPISSLLPEVFAAIFSILCLPGTSSQGRKTDHHLARLRVSHVCHQWREIALNLPLLWTHVDFTSESLSPVGIAETLIRAKVAPLYLEAIFPRHRWDRVRFRTFREELQAHVSHIRYLRTSAGPVLLHSTLKGLVSPAPTLEHLSLSSTSRGHRMRRMAHAGRSTIPDTLFDGSTPRLSFLELRNCNISWRSPLLKGLKYLKILTPSAIARPELTVWLAALGEMQQLTTLTLHLASPIARSFPFVVQRTVALPSLACLDILASPEDCALALAHIDLPALTWLSLTTCSSQPLNRGDVQKLIPFVVRHAHGPQDTQPLKSVLLLSQGCRADILAWPVPNIDADGHALTTTIPPTRVALSFRSDDWIPPDDRLEILDMAIACIPLDGLVMLAAHDLSGSQYEQGLDMQHFWHHLSPNWPLLQCVRLGPAAAPEFISMLLENHEGRERPLLPSLTKLVMVNFSLYSLSLLPLYAALRKRVEQGVPVETLDLRMCRPHPDDREEGWLQSLSKIVGNIRRPDNTSGVSEEREQMESMWNTVARGPFIDNDSSSEDYRSVTGSDDDDGDEE